jgi:hypothetical protein
MVGPFIAILPELADFVKKQSRKTTREHRKCSRDRLPPEEALEGVWWLRERGFCKKIELTQVYGDELSDQQRL